MQKENKRGVFIINNTTSSYGSLLEKAHLSTLYMYMYNRRLLVNLVELKDDKCGSEYTLCSS